MDTTLIIVAVYAFAVTILIVIVTVLYVKVGIDKIDPSQCSSAKGDFAVQAGQVYKTSTGGVAILKKCGTTGIETCETSVPTLKDAITYCNSYPDVCTHFVFFPQIQSVQIIDTSQTLDTNDPSVDMYVRQSSITFV